MRLYQYLYTQAVGAWRAHLNPALHRSLIMKYAFTLACATLLLCAAQTAQAAPEVVLYDRDGAPVAYIDSGDLSIYLWNGEPVAYVQRASGALFNAYGFNGRHLGWYFNGVLYGHDGNAACAIAARLTNTQDLGPRSPRQLLRDKTITDPVPARPEFNNSFAGELCDALLQSGASR